MQTLIVRLLKTFLHRSLILKSQQNGIELVTRPAEEQISKSVLDDEKSVSSELKEIGPMYLKSASDHYAKALDLMAKQDEDEAVDEMWLLHFMKGKIKEKQGQPRVEALKEYMRALEKLLAEGATVPKKINFNNPQDYALELLEVYYRIHASIVKTELRVKTRPDHSLSTLNQFLEVLGQVESVGVFPGSAGQTSTVDKAALTGLITDYSLFCFLFVKNHGFACRAN